MVHLHIYSLPAFTSTNLELWCNLYVQLNESDFKPLVVTDDSSVILNQLHVDEQGTYRCSLKGNGTVFYQVTFLLNGRVTALRHTVSQILSGKLSLKGQQARSYRIERCESWIRNTKNLFTPCLKINSKHLSIARLVISNCTVNVCLCLWFVSVGWRQGVSISLRIWVFFFLFACSDLWSFLNFM